MVRIFEFRYYALLNTQDLMVEYLYFYSGIYNHQQLLKLMSYTIHTINVLYNGVDFGLINASPKGQPLPSDPLLGDEEFTQMIFDFLFHCCWIILWLNLHPGIYGDLNIFWLDNTQISGNKPVHIQMSAHSVKKLLAWFRWLQNTNTIWDNGNFYQIFIIRTKA